MTSIDYHIAFTVNNFPEEVYSAICRVPEWWSKNVEGNTDQLQDEFTILFGETFVRFRITEMIPDRKITWLVTDCYLHFLKDKTEWTDTQVEFEISVTPDGTKMEMTHAGLEPGIECYENCKAGWDFYAGKSLLKLITEKKGQPDTSAANR